LNSKVKEKKHERVFRDRLRDLDDPETETETETGTGCPGPDQGIQIRRKTMKNYHFVVKNREDFDYRRIIAENEGADVLVIVPDFGDSALVVCRAEWVKEFDASAPGLGAENLGPGWGYVLNYKIDQSLCWAPAGSAAGWRSRVIDKTTIPGVLSEIKAAREHLEKRSYGFRVILP
jgi:hypothetical protein